MEIHGIPLASPHGVLVAVVVVTVGSAVVFGSSKGEWSYLYEVRDTDCATNSALIYLLKLLSLLPLLLLPLLFRHVEAS